MIFFNDPLEIYKLYRSRIEQQSGLLTQRVSVVIPLQAALLFAWAAVRQDQAGIIADFHWLRAFIPMIALSQLLLAFTGAKSSWDAIASLKKHFNNFDKRTEHHITILDAQNQPVKMNELVSKEDQWDTSLLPPLTSERKIYQHGHTATMLILLLLALTWLFILVSPYIKGHGMGI